MFNLEKERIAFEDYIIKKHPHRSAKILTQKQEDDDNVYRIASIEECWHTWQACALLKQDSMDKVEKIENPELVYAPKIPTDQMISYCQTEKAKTGKSKSYIFDDIYAYKLMIESITDKTS